MYVFGRKVLATEKPTKIKVQKQIPTKRSQQQLVREQNEVFELFEITRMLRLADGKGGIEAKSLNKNFQDGLLWDICL